MDFGTIEEELRKLRLEKVELENICEQESECLVNKLTKEKSQLQHSKHHLQAQLQHCPAHEQLVKVVDEYSIICDHSRSAHVSPLRWLSQHMRDD
jgi:hypothetical protein